MTVQIPVGLHCQISKKKKKQRGRVSREVSFNIFSDKEVRTLQYSTDYQSDKMVFHASAKRLIIISDCPGNKQAVYVATCWCIPVTAWTTWHFTPGKRRRSEDKVKFLRHEQQNRFFLELWQIYYWQISGDLWFGSTQTLSRDSVFPVLASKWCRYKWLLYCELNSGIIYQMSGRDTQPYRCQESALNARITADRHSVS